MDRRIVVGVDGSAQALAALRYGAELAGRRRTGLLLVHGYLYPTGFGVPGFNAYIPPLPDVRADSRTLLDQTAAIVAAEYPYLEVDTAQVDAGGATALIERSRGAEALVVGHRGIGGFTELLVGSVGTQVAAHAQCPVVIVRPPATKSSDAPVVVGVDGSDSSVTAAQFAFEEAADRGLPLLAIHVLPDYDSESPAEAEGILDRVLGPLAAKFPDVEVRRSTRVGPDGENTLVEASRTARLVVVGSRGRGGFTGMLLGSVSQALVHHAHSPIAVVHQRSVDSGPAHR